MTARDVAIALRRLIDSPWACHSLVAGDDYVLSGLDLNADERALLVKDLDGALDDLPAKLASACVDPLLRSPAKAGVFFAAAQYVMLGLEQEIADFQDFLGKQAAKR
jgi:hypothetical protein